MKKIIVNIFLLIVLTQSILGSNGEELMKFKNRFQKNVGKIVQLDNENGYLIEAIEYCSYKLRGDRKNVDVIIKINDNRVLDYKLKNNDLYFKIVLFIIEDGKFLGDEHYYVNSKNIELLKDIEDVKKIIEFMDKRSSNDRFFLEP